MKPELRNKQFGFKRFLNSFKYSLSGLKYAYLHEQSMFIHGLSLILTIILGFILKINSIEWILILSLLCLVAVIELINTAIEATVDLVTKEYHPLAKIAKDTASGAVFLISIVTLLVGLSIFIPKLISLF
ncbi:MAG: diacylglycerol kinase [Bacilli bacterium]